MVDIRQKVTDRQTGNNGQPLARYLTLEDVAHAAYSPVATYGGNAGAGGIELVQTVPTGYILILTHATLFDVSANFPVSICVGLRGADYAAGDYEQVANASRYLDALGADCNMPGNLISHPLVLDEGEHLIVVTGGAGVVVYMRYVLLAKGGEPQ